jgi:hypothetical protein
MSLRLDQQASQHELSVSKRLGLCELRKKWQKTSSYVMRNILIVDEKT